ncbi:SDR family oxidoreductase [Streptosporangium algeriense]|uniref:SDR family oxidoreductase n=1 Tax=Streptosporangium algeriense TaxID=1682748 RepID=A0ABW3DTM2_9ACTN
MSVWFVTGASRGFGREIVIAALKAGHQVVATVRDPGTDRLPQGYGERLLTTRLDVTHSRQAETAVAEAVTAFGRIDVLVNNAGYGLLGAVEETSDAEVRRLFDTNVFGLLSVTRAVLPIMRGQGAGHVINLSSIAAISTVAGLSAYAATKHAVEGICEALAEEVSPYGVKVTSVQPGSFRTDFLNATSFRPPVRLRRDRPRSGRPSGEQARQPAWRSGGGRRGDHLDRGRRPGARETASGQRLRSGAGRRTARPGRRAGRLA